MFKGEVGQLAVRRAVRIAAIAAIGLRGRFERG